MPVIKSAKKKLRQDKNRTAQNAVLRSQLSLAVKKAKKKATLETIKTATKIVDKAVKNRLIHKNKAARIKSGLSKLLKPVQKTSPQTKTKKASKKTA